MYAFDIDDRTDLAALVQRIDATCRSLGFTNYELRALGIDGRTLGSEHVDLTTSPPGANRRDTSPDEQVAFQAIVEYGRLLSQLVSALQLEQTALRQEGCELRRLLTRLEEVRFQVGQQSPTERKRRIQGHRRKGRGRWPSRR